MKKYFLLSMLAMVFGASTIMAQATQKKANALTKVAILKLQTEVGFDNNKASKIYEAFETYYKAKAPITVGMPQSEIIEKDNFGGFDAISEKRDEALKVVLSAVQFTKWTQIKKAFTQAIVEVN